MLAKLKQLLSRSQRNIDPFPGCDDDPDLEWLRPPANPLDVAGWDRYWFEYLRHGIGPQLLDMFCDDRDLVRVMNAEGMKSVLCAGNGISQEPRALAEAGFEVVALDISPQAVEYARDFAFPSEGFEFFCEPDMRRSGGNVEYVVGNILDSSVCPGPFDVIIERSTAQNYLTHGQPALMMALSERLSQNGIFFSHSHDGSWNPDREIRYFTADWFAFNGWTIRWDKTLAEKPAGRVAWLFTSTG